MKYFYYPGRTNRQLNMLRSPKIKITDIFRFLACQIISDQFFYLQAGQLFAGQLFTGQLFTGLVRYYLTIFFNDCNWSAIYRVSQKSAGQLFNWSDK